jgi:hypothetical protein
MSKPHLVKPNLGAPARTSSPWRNVGMVVLVLVLVNAAMLGSWWWKTRHKSESDTKMENGGSNIAADTNQSSSAAATGASATPPSTTSADFEKLIANWVRPDGGYILQIKSVDQTGKLDAGYYNPSPIHVAKAEASRDGGVMKVFVELRDVNYPGSTYTLTHDAATDQLKGIYFQAVQQQNYEVVFDRWKN